MKHIGFSYAIALVVPGLFLAGCDSDGDFKFSSNAGGTDFINFTHNTIETKTLASTEPEEVNSIRFVFRDDNFSPLPTPGPERP